MDKIKDFIDRVKIYVKGGKGGNGCVSFRREKFVPKGGPDGGDGGDGGNVIIESSLRYNTLTHLAYHPHIVAGDGEDGGSANKKGKKGSDVIVYVPCGTIIKDVDGNIIADLVSDKTRIVIAKGGKGGRGNAYFKSSINQTPTIRELGEKGEEKIIILELLLIADVGLVGFPNAGKSTFLSRITSARPKIADYPFTTLKPNLGICVHKENSFVVADIPGLIEGASHGKGLGHDFLRHISRTRILLHIIDPYGYYGIDPVESVKIIEKELKAYSHDLIEKPRILVVNKSDLPGANEVYERIKHRYKTDVYLISSVTGDGIERLLNKIVEMLSRMKFEKKDLELENKETKMVFVEKGYTVEKKNGIFYIKGRTVERIANMTDKENEESLRRMYNIFRKIGIIKELKKQGIKNGNTVIIGDFEFEWRDED